MTRKRQCTHYNSLVVVNAFVMLCMYLNFFIFVTSSLSSNYDHETKVTLKETATSLEMFVDELPRMPIINGYIQTSSDGEILPANLTIGMYLKTWKFHRDLPPSQVFAFGKSKEEATIPGPTIRAMGGVKTYVKWENHLPNHHLFVVDPTLGGPSNNTQLVGVPTVVHLHGGVTEPESDGNMLAWFTRDFKHRGPKWTKEVYEYANVKETSSMWYHDHTDAYTRLNILAGLVGAYKVINPTLEYHTWKLPHKRFELELLVMDRDFTKMGQIYMNSTGNNPSTHTQWQPEYFGDVVVVNGKAWPYLKVQRRKYRFRIINTSNARFYAFAFHNGMHFIQIGSDNFYLEKPIRMKEIVVAPSEIVDVIVDFSISNSNVAILTNNASYPFPNGNPVNERNGKVMKFLIHKQISQETARVPMQLVKVERLTLNITYKRRNIVLYEFGSPNSKRPTHLLINFKRFTDPVTEMPTMGTNEIWHIINLTPDNHPFHVHLVGFQVVHQQKLKETLGGLINCVVENQGVENCNLENFFDGPPKPPLVNEAGWKNVYKVKPLHVTSIVVRFSLIDSRLFPFDPTKQPGYTYHCHILDHEDNAMMRPFQIIH